MGNCSACGDQYVTKLHYDSGSGSWLCSKCYTAPPTRYDPRVQVAWQDGTGSISVGHLKDIQARRVGPDGKVYRDTGRKFI